MLSFGTSPIAWRAAVAAVALACFLLRLAKVGLYSFPLTLTCFQKKERKEASVKKCLFTSLFEAAVHSSCKHIFYVIPL